MPTQSFINQNHELLVVEDAQQDARCAGRAAAVERGLGFGLVPGPAPATAAMVNVLLRDARRL